MSASPSRSATLSRSTQETQVSVSLCLDGNGTHDVQTPLPFLDHMLEQLARHSLMNLELRASGDTQVDGHHTTEDVGIVLGQAVHDALGERRGIQRFGTATIPMDEALIRVTLDLSGRPYFVWKVDLPKAQIGTWDAELAEVFFEAFARTARINLHVEQLSGRNLHHIVEASFKALARALRSALELDPRAGEIPSTKGILV